MTKNAWQLLMFVDAVLCGVILWYYVYFVRVSSRTNSWRDTQSFCIADKDVCGYSEDSYWVRSQSRRSTPLCVTSPQYERMYSCFGDTSTLSCVINLDISSSQLKDAYEYNTPTNTPENVIPLVIVLACLCLFMHVLRLMFVSSCVEAVDAREMNTNLNQMLKLVFIIEVFMAITIAFGNNFYLSVDVPCRTNDDLCLEVSACGASIMSVIHPNNTVIELFPDVKVAFAVLLLVLKLLSVLLFPGRMFGLICCGNAYADGAYFNSYSDSSAIYADSDDDTTLELPITWPWPIPTQTTGLFANMQTAFQSNFTFTTTSIPNGSFLPPCWKELSAKELPEDVTDCSVCLNGFHTKVKPQPGTKTSLFQNFSLSAEKVVPAHISNMDIGQQDVPVSDETVLDPHKLIKVPCGHYFHLHCIRQWYQASTVAAERSGVGGAPSCPVCRKSLCTDQDSSNRNPSAAPAHTLDSPDDSGYDEESLDYS